ncbi:helix-turn-helix domain-containing protein [Clostridioides sp. ES-S-0108-01]|uniref:PucR family transcriptional regulator n=1 Tax=Clostridioides sp. ES-S-0108-01 TaxID=2770773 RepID=UPI001D0CAA71|nr:helix-turn-helix domain-containing protein [Clostridioides sp. ES-S-0108-01]UDN50129.1 helix-turn-helix domain-containing protein [Clostridioides sp. ES-S-0107-01]
MEELKGFLEKQLNKKINIYPYENQRLNANSHLVTFNNAIYVIDFLDKNNLDNLKGNFYLIYQSHIDFEYIKNIFYNLYDDINIIQLNGFIVVNSKYDLDINVTTQNIIETETYQSTYIFYLGELDNKFDFDFRLQLCSDLLPHIVKDNAENKFLNLFDLIRYKTLDLINEDNILNKLIDFNKIKSIDEELLYTGIKFINNDLNISKTSTSMFLHRNTLVYRLEKINEILGFDLKNFESAMIFYLSVKSYFLYKKI